MHYTIYAPLWKRRAYCFAPVGRYVGRYVGMFYIDLCVILTCKSILAIRILVIIFKYEFILD